MMSVTAKVQIEVELSEKEYEIILALREMPEPRRISTENTIFGTPSLPKGIDTKELIAFLEDWRKELDPEDIQAMRSALAELRQPEEDDENAKPTSF